MSGGTYVEPGINLPEDIIQAATVALHKPNDFGYWGGNLPEDGWGWVGLVAAINEDDPINRSNLRVIESDLRSRWPDDVANERSQHWAVGPIDELRVKVLVDPGQPINEANLTPAFLALMEWRRKLESYPLADESDYSDLEYEEASAAGWTMCEEHGEYDDCNKEDN